MGLPSPTKAFSFQLNELELDGFSGACRVRRVEIREAVGDSLSALIRRGQPSRAIPGPAKSRLQSVREPPMMLANSVREAIRHAIAAYGILELASPVTRALCAESEIAETAVEAVRI
jgi:xanthine dehydrogenase molybdopterin-binding subunit B